MTRIPKKMLATWALPKTISRADLKSLGACGRGLRRVFGTRQHMRPSPAALRRLAASHPSDVTWLASALVNKLRIGDEPNLALASMIDHRFYRFEDEAFRAARSKAGIGQFDILTTAKARKQLQLVALVMVEKLFIPATFGVA